MNSGDRPQSLEQSALNIAYYVRITAKRWLFSREILRYSVVTTRQSVIFLVDPSHRQLYGAR